MVKTAINRSLLWILCSNIIFKQGFLALHIKHDPIWLEIVECSLISKTHQYPINPPKILLHLAFKAATATAYTTN